MFMLSDVEAETYDFINSLGSIRLLLYVHFDVNHYNPINYIKIYILSINTNINEYYKHPQLYSPFFYPLISISFF